MLTAVYTRVSTGVQAAEGHSLAVQREQCIHYARALGVSQTDIRVYEEAGASGEDMERPALLALLDDARRGAIARVVIKHPDRLSRNVADKAIIVRELQQCGVELHFVDVPNWDQSDEAVLLFHIISSIAEYELRQIRRRTLSGKLRAAKGGQYMPTGIDPYGYRYESGKLVIVESEAAVVRMVYRWYAYEQLSLRAIAKRLDALGVPTKTRLSATWSHATVGHILANPMYTGTWYFNRRSTRKALRIARRVPGIKRSGRRVVVGWRQPSDWICIPVPPIVEPSLAEAVNVRRQARARGRTGKAKRHLLAGCLVCSVCRQAWYSSATMKSEGDAMRWYRRPPETGRQAPRCPYRCKRVPAAAVEQLVWRELVHRIVTSQVWNDVWDSLSRSGVHGGVTEELRQMAAQLTTLQAAKVRLATLYAYGDLDANTYMARKRETQARWYALREQVCRRCIAHRVEAAKGKDDRERVEAWLLAASAEEFEERRAWIEAVIDRVDMDARGESVRLTVHPRIEL
ncbi:site-specific DNA recombinase [Alicyclobacillus sacchari]|uniref:Site-specific DNA recombinase n=2 Tax=Alicyclobacillus sacchari TaxID=392010 RepID=A0A4R8LR72_9BACL|nr:recombinase family protein [Alicyclobacillus sacchari]TDY49582.1 site-specific DNA recombinase [Alicyclobacillus sacchari]